MVANRPRIIHLGLRLDLRIRHGRTKRGHLLYPSLSSSSSSSSSESGNSERYVSHQVPGSRSRRGPSENLYVSEPEVTSG